MMCAILSTLAYGKSPDHGPVTVQSEGLMRRITDVRLTGLAMRAMQKWLTANRASAARAASPARFCGDSYLIVILRRDSRHYWWPSLAWLSFLTALPCGC